MPRLGKPCFPVLVSAADATVQVKELLEKNNWDEEETQIKTPSLVFLPYWFFHFDSFREETDPESQEKTTIEGDRGTAALDALTGDLDEAVPPLFDNYSDQLTSKPSVEHYKVERSHFRDTEVQKLAQLRMAAKLSIPKDDVVISGVRLVYLPVWIVSAVFEDNEMDFEIDAVEGELVSEEEVPFKGKTASELAQETLLDLRNPAKWIQYAVDLARSILHLLWTNPASIWFREQFASNRQFQIGVLVLLLALIVLNEALFHWWR